MSAAQGSVVQSWPDLAGWLEKRFGGARFGFEPMPGGASARRYVRLRVEGGAWPRALAQLFEQAGDGRAASILAMIWPSERTGTAVDFDPEPFVVVQGFLHTLKIAVPHVYVVDADARVMLLDDLGDMTLEQKLNETPKAHWHEVYRPVLDMLARLHGAARLDTLPEVVRQRVMHRAQLRDELEHFLEWGTLPIRDLDDAERATLSAFFDGLADEVAGLAQGFVHRDFQSRNLMFRDGVSPSVIDFQDALVGPALYDVVALLCDSYIDFDPALQISLLEHYLDARGFVGEVRAEAAAGFWTIAMQRKLKDAGRFVFLDKVRGQPEFMRWYPQSLVYVLRALERSGGPALLEGLLKRALDAGDTAGLP